MTAKCPKLLALNCKDRFGAVKSKQLCFCCFGRDHIAKDCGARCGLCKGRHHNLLCMQGTGDQFRSVGPRGSVGGGADVFEEREAPPSQSALNGGARHGQSGPGVSLSCTTGNVTLLPIASVFVESGLGPVKANLISDSGADKSFVSERLMKQVKGEFKGSVEMTCASFGGGKSTGVCDVYELKVASPNMFVSTAIALQAVKVPVICAPLVRPRVPPDALPYPMRHLQLASDCTSSEPTLHIDIVVGQDQYWSLIRSGLVRSSEGLVAMETVFGWVLSGPVKGAEGSHGGMNVRQLLTMTSMVPVGVRHIWGTDDLTESDEMPDSVLAEFNSTVKYDNGRYEVQIPWKRDMKAQLMDNCEAAQQSGMSRQKVVKKPRAANRL